MKVALSPSVLVLIFINDRLFLYTLPREFVMIPLRIQIKNFLSYGADQTIEFHSYPLICLSGKNGHGKSALFRRVNLGVWGQARKIGGVAKADEGLLHLGQTNMAVTLNFILRSYYL